MYDLFFDDTICGSLLLVTVFLKSININDKNYQLLHDLRWTILPWDNIL